MTISRGTTRLQVQHPPIDEDGHWLPNGSIEREEIRTGAVRSRNSDAERVRESTSSRLGGIVRIAFGLIWLVDAYFKWQPAFLDGMLGIVHDGAMGQPAWLMPWFNANQTIVATQPTLWAYLTAIVETGIALALLFGAARKLTYVGGAIWSLLIWMTAEGFGRTASGVATDIGTAIVYAVVFLAFLALDQCDGTRRYSVDAVIERRLPWWRRIAEVRK
jgi:thiosulfate dehydrogenase (quinone) large subunit